MQGLKRDEIPYAEAIKLICFIEGGSGLGKGVVIILLWGLREWGDETGRFITVGYSQSANHLHNLKSLSEFTQR